MAGEVIEAGLHPRCLSVLPLSEEVIPLGGQGGDLGNNLLGAVKRLKIAQRHAEMLP